MPNPRILAGAAETETARERRHELRYNTDVRAVVLLVNSRILSPARILDLSMGGCRVRSEKRFEMGIFIRLEIEFEIHGICFRIGGVTQHIVDPNTFGVRFLDVSARRREQLVELIDEIAQAEACD